MSGRFSPSRLARAALAWLPRPRQTGQLRAEEALRQSEERYMRAMAAAEAGFWDWDVVQDKYYLSPRLLEMAGLPPNTTIAGRADFQSRVPLHPEDLEKWKQAIQELFASGGSRLSTELRVIVGTRTRWYRLDGMCFRDAAGRVVRWTGSSIDVTSRKLVEEALRASEQRSSLAMEATEEGHFDLDLDTGEIFVSERLNEIYGFPPGTRFANRGEYLAQLCLHADDAEKYHAALAAAVAKDGAERYEFEFRIVRPSREVRWLWTRGKVTRDAEGRARRRTGVVADITERKLAAEALRESEARKSGMFETALDCIVSIDHEGRVVEFNPAAERTFGYRRAEALGKELAELIIPPRLRAQHREGLARYLKGGASPVLGRRTEMPAVRADGSEFPVELTVTRIATQSAPLFTAYLRDITERKRSEEALRNSEQRYALAMEAAGDGHTDWDLQTGEHYISPRLLEICGYAPGTTFRDRAEWVRRFPFHPEDRPKWERAVAAHFAGRESHFKMELRIVVRGEVRWTAFHFLCTRDAAGAPIRWTGSVGDITEQKRADEALRESEQRYERAMLASNAGLWEWDARSDEYYCSPRHLELLGFAPGTRFSGREDFLRRVPFHPEDLERWQQAQRQLFESGGSYLVMDLRVIGSGETRWLRVNALCFRDGAGAVARWTGSVTDVTEAKRAEEALRESQERYALAVAGSDDGVWDVDFISGRVFLSARARELAGLPSGPEMVAFDEFLASMPLHPDDVPRRVAAMQAHLTGKAPAYEGEFRLRQLDGVYRWRRVHGICVRDTNGRPTRMAGSFSDIDARRRAEDALRASEERYALAMAVADEGHLDWNVQTGEFFASAQAKRVMNVPEDAECRPRDDVMTRVPYHPDDAERVSAAWRASFAGGEVEHELEYRILRGEEPRWIRARWRIFRSADGVPQRVIGVVSDITERRQAVETLRESESRFRALTELSSDAYWVQDEHLRFLPTGANNDLAGHPSDSHVGKTRWELSNATPLSETWAEHEAVLQARKPFRDFEYRRPGADGSVRYLSISGAPMFDDRGQFRGYQGVGRDITGRKRGEEEVRESEARFRSLVELSSDWYWKQDENLRFVSYVPPDVGSRSGVDAASSLGKARWEFDDVTPLSGTWEEHKALLAARQPFRDFEYLRLDEKGVPHYTVISGVPLFDEHGRFTGYHGVGRNISERRRMEEDLRKSEARFRALTELSSDWYWRQDEDLRFTYVSGQVADTDLYPRDWVIGKRRWELPGITPLSFTWAEHQAAVAARQPFRDLEYGRVARDGRMEYVSISGAPVYDENGHFRGYQGIGRNITERKRIEEELRASEARFRRMSELSADTYWEQDENFRYTRTGTDQDIAGYAIDVNHGKTRWELCGEATPLAGSWLQHQAVLAAHQPFRDFEYRRRRPDGAIGYYSASGAPMFDAEGRFRGYQGVARDITEFKRVEEELRSRQEMLELAQTSARVVAFEWRIGADGPYRNRWSPELAAMYGVAPQAYDGSFEQWKKLIYRDDWPAVRGAIKHALRTGDVATEYRVVHADGSVHWLQAKGRMFFDAAGKPARMLGFMHDVTERKRVEQALHQSEERYALAVAGSNEGIFDWDLVSDRMYMSQRAQELFGLPLGELWRPRPQWRSLVTVYPDDARPVRQVLSAHIAGEAPYDVEFRVCMPDGSIRWFRQRGIALRDASGKAYRMVGSIGDVTEKHVVEEELKGLERKLRQAQRLEAMGTLAGGIAHDFNNILGAILGYGEMALRNADKGSRLRRDLDSIVVAGERGRALVDRVLAFSRSGVGERVPVHVEKVAREALDLVSAKLPPNVTLHAKLHAHSAAMLGDATQVHQVLMNLATNAIQAMPAGGRLRVSLSAVRLETARAPTIGILERGEYLVLEVADTGSGIPPEILDRIFDPFFTTKEVGTGTGLGLSLVHGIVTELGGAIDVASTVGAGSTFTVYLPRSGDVVDHDREEEAEMPRGEGQRVLVVDDEEPLVRLATRTLEELGYAPVGFTSSTKALAAFRADPKRFDVVITDERMPGLSGTALIREVRGLHGSIPIVLMSGHVGAAVARQAREAGAEEVLKKPLSARDLAASLARVLHS